MGVAMAAAAMASAASGMTVSAPRKSMAYHKLGSSDLMVSSCCLGTGELVRMPWLAAASAASHHSGGPPAGPRAARWAPEAGYPRLPIVKLQVACKCLSIARSRQHRMPTLGCDWPRLQRLIGDPRRLGVAHHTMG